MSQSNLKTGARHIAKGIFFNARGASMFAAVLLDFYLVWLFFLHTAHGVVLHKETFWVGAFVAAMVYTILQIWTLANVTGRGDDFAAACDKVVALTPLLVFAVAEAYWIGTGNATMIPWRVHLIGCFWSLYSLADFFSTDITNQRLRSRQIGLPMQS